MINYLKDFWEDESGIGVVEVVLILVVLIGLVMVFKDQITDILEDVFKEIEKKTSKLY